MRLPSLLRLVPEAPSAIGTLLDATRGPAEPPIRAEIFGPERFAEHGRSLGATHRAAPRRAGASTFFPRLHDNVAVLREAHQAIGMQAASGYDVSPAGEWLLDNFHLIEAQLDQVRDGLPLSYFRTLPVLLDEPLAGLPRVYGIAWAFVAHTDSAFDETLLVHFLVAYQQARELHLSEMWALPTTLRVLLIENLRRLAERIAIHKAAREIANLCCDRIDTWSVPALAELLALLEQRGVGRMFLVQMAQRLQAGRTLGIAADPPGLAAWLQAVLPDPAVAQAQHSAGQTADNLSVGNAITSLRTLGDADWTDIVARASALMQRLRAAPLFEAEHPSTRDQTLHAIERLARRSGRSELEVADALLRHLHAAPADDTDAALADFWLCGAGRATLAAELGLREPWARRWQAAVARGALPAYLALLGGGTLALVAAVLGPAARAGAGPPDGWWLLAAVLMLLPASEAVIAVVHRLIGESTRPRRLPRLALARGIPAEHRVLVAVPALLPDERTIDQLVHRLRLHQLANPEPHAQFALLTDAPDAPAQHAPADAALLAHAVQAVSALNALHPAADGAPATFLLLHRERRYSVSEQAWIGWERKRGKLEQLIALLATGADGAFLDLGALSRPAAGTRHVLTLDSDTQLPPGRLRELVGVAAHPRNRPRLDAAQRRVVAGHGILQPRLLTPLPSPRERTPFHWLFAGRCGLDPYSAASTEVYQDLFDEGSFTGKGLLDVQAMHRVLHARLPEAQVLSHDLLEGALLRCAAVTDIALLEEVPGHADVAAARVHRWTRGDWQLLPLLARRSGLPLRALQRWKMLDNLRRSLVAPASLALLLLALAGRVGPWWVVLAVVAAAAVAGPLLGALASFASPRRDLARLRLHAAALTDLARALAVGLWFVALLLPQAMAALDAIGRALWRSAVSRRHLLQWTTAATAQSQAPTALVPLLRRHAPEPLAAVAVFGLLLAVGTPHPGLAAALCALWAASPLSIGWASRPLPPPRAQRLRARERAALHGIAQETWSFFARCVGADDHHLPPDNLQIVPHDAVAHRTSPTNIGLYLLSVACARAFDWIGTAELLERLEATLASLQGLERHRGHFLNWYDTQTAQPLLPRYVSTVDSGNLCGHLLAVAAACSELAAGTDDACEQRRLHALAHAFEALAWAPAFDFLYDAHRHLFHIGYRVAEQRVDGGYYDLLASESRLTSLLAIAKGEVPVRHWVALARPFYGLHAAMALRSWSGSMFEYLMPSLVLDEPRGSVLHDAGAGAVREQIAFGQQHALPWGLSESAHAGRDHTLAYQYGPQGVPRLALRRTPPDELVVAPYATALAAQIAPQAALRNFARLEALGARRRHGFIEALDFSAARQSGPGRCTPVATFMAHHQGMTIVALANVLLDGLPRRWGMAHPRIEAVASLLHERSPREVPRLAARIADAPPRAARSRVAGLQRDVAPGTGAVEPTHVLGNGRYSVTLRPNGAGASRWGALGLTRVRDDALRDALGSFLYLRRSREGTPVSLTQHPAPDPAAQYRCHFQADRVCFEAVWPGLRAETTVWVSPEDDIEFRRVTLHNLGDRPVELELIASFEPTLELPRADEAHPAFSNLFVRATWQPSAQAVLLERRPRVADARGLHVAHFLAGVPDGLLGIAVQAERQRWQGRNRAPSRPLAALDAMPFDAEAPPRTLRTGLDPVCALGVRLRIAAGAKTELSFATAAADDEATLRAVVDRHRQPSHVERASLMSATLAGIRLQTLGIGTEAFAAVQTLTTALVLGLTRPRSPGAAPVDAGGACNRRSLWSHGISGDRPIVLVSAGVVQGLGLLRAVAQALRLWAWGRVDCDLVVVNAEAASYEMPLQRELGALRDRHHADGEARPGPASTGFHVLRSDDVSAETMATLQALARVRLQADGRPLWHHVREWVELHELALERRERGSHVALPTVDESVHAARPPRGAFERDSGAFTFEVAAARRPLRPWINVLSNPGFGAQVSEAGGGFTWAGNSRLNQLTGWSNDAVADPPSEWFLLQDLRSMAVWSTAAGAWGESGLCYEVEHRPGETTIQHRRGELEVSCSWCVDAAQAVKQVRLRVMNHGRRPALLRLVAVAEWTMGAGRADRASVHTALHRQRLPHGKLTALLGTQREQSAGFGGGTAFLALAGAPDEPEDWTCDRRECFDARGHPVLPDHFDQRAGDGLDPCAALSARVTVLSGAAVERVFLIGWAAQPAAACRLAALAAAEAASRRSEAVAAGWDALLGATTVATPDRLFDVLVNRWLLYQAVSCRLWAKAGFYQAGGATGYRDQLQDTMALAWAAPALLRAQIVLCASRQFPEGDVQHWWHAPLGAGVRTHFSDDLLWLAHACVHYLRATDDLALLDERVPFLEGPAIPPGAEDCYDTPTVSAQTATVYEHAARAIDHSLRVGAHGLPLMGSGDWNDGMNRVGHEGRGESVWLAWFLLRLVSDFAPLALARGDTERAQRWTQAAEGWQAAVEAAGWDGRWYRRAFFDNGQTLGSQADAEARIDLIAQAWAVLSGAAPPARQRLAMDAVEAHLADADAGLLRLLDPPLSHTQPSAGYIQAYPPGVRENGGQYAHAGVWALMAEAALARTPADADRVWRDFTWLSPAHRSRDPAHGAAYGLEPYAMAGDVYSQPPYVGRGGWSWYTGAAAWLHRAALESILGLDLRARTLRFRPRLPSHWPQASVTLRRGGRTMHFQLVRNEADADPTAHRLAPGEALDWWALPAHSRFVVLLGAASSTGTATTGIEVGPARGPTPWPTAVAAADLPGPDGNVGDPLYMAARATPTAP